MITQQYITLSEVKFTEKAASKQLKEIEKEAKKIEKEATKAAVKQLKEVEKEATKAAAKQLKEADKAEKEAKKIEKDVNNKMARRTSLSSRVIWATVKPQKIKKKDGITIAQQKKEFQESEKKWGNDMIQQTNNGQWTTLLGEQLVYDVLQLRGENPRKVERKDGFEPDWETDEYIYEVKTSNWWVDGTAGEKVYGTWIKYQNIPELYGKPLRIVCVANQEDELTNGKTKYFGENVTNKTKQILNLASTWNIEYIRFSELILPILPSI
jgi:vacuolar-type H+-ATPase subunit H